MTTSPTQLARKLIPLVEDVRSTSSLILMWMTQCGGEPWADLCAAHYIHVLPAQYEKCLLCNVNSSAQLSSMQSSSSLECTFKWKHSFSLTCRHPPILRVADRASASLSTLRHTDHMYSSSLYTDSVNTASQFKSLCQELPRLVDLILVLQTWWQLSRHCAACNGRCKTNVHVRYVLLIE